MKVLLREASTGKQTIFRRKKFFDCTMRYSVLLYTNRGTLNISNITNVKDKENFLCSLSKAVKTAKAILNKKNGEKNLQYWIAASNDQRFLYDEFFDQEHFPEEVINLDGWAAENIINTGLISKKARDTLYNFIDFHKLAKHLLQNYEHCELENGNTLIYHF